MPSTTERYTEAQQNLTDAQEDAQVVKIALILGFVLATLIPVSIAGCALLASAGMTALAGGAGGLIAFTVVGTGLCVMYLLWNVGGYSDPVSRWEFHKREVRAARRAANMAASRLVSE